MSSLHINKHLNKKQIISISTGVGNSNYTVATAWERYKINLSDLSIITGKKLSHENNSVKVGKNVEKVKVSGVCMYRGFANTTIAGIRINRNGDYIGASIREVYYRPANAGTFLSHVIPETILEVEENDLIEMHIRPAEAGTAEVGSKVQTYITVEVVE